MEGRKCNYLDGHACGNKSCQCGLANLVKHQGEHGGNSEPNNILSSGGPHWERLEWDRTMTRILETAAGVNCLFQGFLKQTVDRVTKGKKNRRELH